MTDATRWDLFVVFKFSSEVAWLDPRTHQARYHLGLPSHCHEMLVDEVRQRCYVSIYGDGIYGNNTQAAHHLAVIDLRSHTLVSIVDLGPNRGSHGLALGVGGVVWVTCDRTGTVVPVDPDTLAAGEPIQLDTWATPHWLVATPDGAKGYTSNKATSHLSVVDLAERRQLRTIAAPNGTEGLALDHAGSLLYVADHSGSGLPMTTTRPPHLSVIDTASDEVVEIVDLDLPELAAGAGRELRVRVTPDDRHVVVTAHAWNGVMVLESGDLRAQELIDVDGGPMGLAFDPDYPDSHRGVVASHDAGELTALDFSTPKVLTKTAPTGTPHEGPEVLGYVPRWD